ncbi:hypothetical protein PLESTM_000263500 [Pleodorina starrii]|nr:hypothetical protein PLESTM_000263500 [Pleodorina starrii]
MLCMVGDGVLISAAQAAGRSSRSSNSNGWKCVALSRDRGHRSMITRDEVLSCPAFEPAFLGAVLGLLFGIFWLRYNVFLDFLGTSVGPSGLALVLEYDNSNGVRYTTTSLHLLREVARRRSGAWCLPPALRLRPSAGVHELELVAA